MRKFNTGAIRDTEENKIDPEGCLSPQVIERYAQYMLAHCTQADGGNRSNDNWQKGFPPSVYMKSGWRHFLALWKLHRAGVKWGDELEEVLCAVLFNAMGYLHVSLLTRHAPARSSGSAPSVVESSPELEKGSQSGVQSNPVPSVPVPGVGV